MTVGEVLSEAADCACIGEMDEKLVEYNGRLVTTLGLFGLPQRVAIEVTKREEKTRKRPPRVVASFCPFCGSKYRTASQAGGVE